MAKIPLQKKLWFAVILSRACIALSLVFSKLQSRVRPYHEKVTVHLEGRRGSKDKVATTKSAS